MMEEQALPCSVSCQGGAVDREHSRGAEEWAPKNMPLQPWLYWLKRDTYTGMGYCADTRYNRLSVSGNSPHTKTHYQDSLSEIKTKQLGFLTFWDIVYTHNRLHFLKFSMNGLSLYCSVTLQYQIGIWCWPTLEV